MTSEELKKLLDAKAVAWMPTGSRYICSPAPTDTDDDYIALMVKGFEQSLELAGFVMGTDPHQYEEMPDFFAYRLGELNVVVTYDKDFFKKFCDATKEAKSLNLTNKDDRVALFQKRLYGSSGDQIFS